MAFMIPASAVAQSSGIRTYANPLDIDYRYNFEQMNQGISYRSGADPVIVNHQGEYYLFATVSGGYWHSRDLLHWRYVTPTRWPFEDIVAPAARSVRDTLYLLQSMTQPRPILLSTAPETGQLEFYNRLFPTPPGSLSPWTQGPPTPGAVPPGPWDPDIFHDPDTDRWYMYWGSSNYYPLFGIELDKSRRLLYTGKPVPLISLHPQRHGWERFGRDHTERRIPFIEGAWMTKHGGRYYLQYAAPGTEYNVYANGTYVGDDPLGPLTYAPYNPISYKPGGFLTGAGHGNTFRDTFGNYWNTGTPWIGVNWNFERRIAMFPTGFDRDGQMFANSRFGDFPHYLPTGKWTDKDDLFTGWMLLSYRKPVSASSVQDTFPAGNVTDENPRTFWVAQRNQPGERLTIDLGGPYDVRAVQVNYADYRSNLYNTDSTVYTQFRMSASMDGQTWQRIADLTHEKRDRPNAYIEMPAPVRARHIRYEHEHVAAANLAISDIRVFGTGAGRAPRTPSGLSARRDADPRNAFVSWDRVPGVVGYNVLWGIARDKLYQTYQVFADGPNSLELRALTVGQEYFLAIEAFNENGVSAASGVAHLPAGPPPPAPASPVERPNVVILFADDLGYGDLGEYGHPTIRTPNLDRMAREGTRLTTFYVASPVCTPSRAALLTGRHAIRSGMTDVLFPNATTGLPAVEVTLAEALQQRGYRTAAIGTWHLGHLPRYLPTSQGFDVYFGVPYSNDMDDVHDPPVPLLRDTVVIEAPVDQATLTQRYTSEAIRFMRESREHPFFVYLAYTAPHVPLDASREFRGRSRAGLYGDVIEELDWSVGQVLDAIGALGLDRETLVIFTSDNGPWLEFPDRHGRQYGTMPWHGGSAGPLRGGKTSTYEGGMRVPAIVRWPGVVPPGVESADIASTLDLYPTVVRLSGGKLPRDRTLDGHDIFPLLTGAAPSPVQEFYYFRHERLEAVRQGKWKLRLAGAPPVPELFDLDVDPGERFNLAAEHPEIVARLRERMQAFARQVAVTGK